MEGITTQGKESFFMTSQTVDIHIHLLPGVDDGPPAMGDSFALARVCAEAGTGIAICTPHLMVGEWENTRSRVLPAVKNLRNELNSAGIDLQIHPGAEVMAHPSLLNLYDEGELPTLGDHGVHLLLELPWDLWPPGIDDLIFNLQQRGLEIIIAHPERYGPVRQDPDVVGRWVERGVMMQVTARCFDGSESTSAKLARRLLENGWVHFLASDSHSARRSPALGPALDKIAHDYGRKARDQAMENAAAVVGGSARRLPPLPVTKRRRRWFWWPR